MAVSNVVVHFHPKPKATSTGDNLQCHRALFMNNAWLGVAVFLFFALAILSIIMIIWIQSLVFKPAPPPEATSSPSSSEETSAIPTQGDAEAPPPYEAPAPAPASTPAPASRVPGFPSIPKKKRSRASAFVIGSFAFILLLFTLVTDALSIQNLAFCHGRRVNKVWVSLAWYVYGVLCVYASFGFSSWLMLVRNLWGKKVEEKWPIADAVVLYTLIGIVIAPFVILWLALTTGLEKAGTPLVRGVEALQRRLCGDDALDDDEEEGVTLEEGHGLLQDGESVDNTEGDEEQSTHPVKGTTGSESAQ